MTGPRVEIVRPEAPRSTLVEPTVVVSSERCANGCGERMVITHDALRRPRKRCPKCDGVARHVQVHPDTVLVPVRLEPRSAFVLPPIAPGELRCQGCARGVPTSVRFCAECKGRRSEETRGDSHARPCPTCGSAIPVRRGLPPHDCEACR